MDMRYGLFLLFILIFSGIFAIYLVNSNTFKVELVQVLFRHGDRLPDKSTVYNTDPFDPEHYVIPGYGKLTNIGKQREFRIGRLLKEHYGNFIGSYNPDYVYGYSTDYDRTKASLQIVLAGLFSSPTDEFMLKKILSWKSVVTHYEPFDTDFILGPILDICTNFDSLLKEVETFSEIEKRLKKYDSILNFIRNETGMGSSRPFTAIFLAGNIEAVKHMGLKLPSWVTKEVIDAFIEISALFWDTVTLTPELRKITAGPMVKELLENMENHEKGDKRRIYLYSAHDLNVATFTRAHNFSGLPPNPAYGSAVILEKLRGNDDKSYVRMFLWTGVGEKLMKLKLDNCDYECPLEEYDKIVTPLLPDFDFNACISNNSFGKVQLGNEKVINPDFRMTYVIAGDDTMTFKYGDELYINN